VNCHYHKPGAFGDEKSRLANRREHHISFQKILEMMYPNRRFQGNEPISANDLNENVST
jgi:hypothetical protein